MNHLNPVRTGLALGAIISGLHILWSLVVLVGLGQAWVDFVTWAHMIHASYVVGQFDIGAALTVIILAAIIGFVVGFAFATVWNRIHVKK